MVPGGGRIAGTPIKQKRERKKKKGPCLDCCTICTISRSSGIERCYSGAGGVTPRRERVRERAGKRRDVEKEFIFILSLRFSPHGSNRKRRRTNNVYRAVCTTGCSFGRTVDDAGRGRYFSRVNPLLAGNRNNTNNIPPSCDFRRPGRYDYPRSGVTGVLALSV